jgi:hypothetical protein
MTHPQLPQPLPPLDLPPLPDDAAVALLDVLHELLFQIESHYLGHLHRDEADRDADARRQPLDLFDHTLDFDDPLDF